MKSLLSALLALSVCGLPAVAGEVAHDSTSADQPIIHGDAYGQHGMQATTVYADSGAYSGAGCPTCGYGEQYLGCPASNGTQWGCCDRPWTPNMHLWDGYCAQKARWHAWLQSVKHRLQQQSCDACPCGDHCGLPCVESTGCDACCGSSIGCDACDSGWGLFRGGLFRGGSSCCDLGCDVEACQSPCGRGPNCTDMDGYGVSESSFDEDSASPADATPAVPHDVPAPVPPAPQASSDSRPAEEATADSGDTRPLFVLPNDLTDDESAPAAELRVRSDDAVEAPQPELELSR